jgi:YgiT-type zinc finger domain-containing protein
MDKFNKPQRAASDTNCPNCGSTEVTTSYEQQKFLYGKEEVPLFAEVPVHGCSQCNFRFTDSDGEEARENAIRRYLDVPSPKEIEAIRRRYEMSRSEFADVSGLGSASLARWEAGTLIPNVANARYMFLLSFSDNLIRLRERYLRRRFEMDLSIPQRYEEVFTALVNVEHAAACAAKWSLRGVSKEH